VHSLPTVKKRKAIEPVIFCAPQRDRANRERKSLNIQKTDVGSPEENYLSKLSLAKTQSTMELIAQIKGAFAAARESAHCLKLTHPLALV